MEKDVDNVISHDMSLAETPSFIEVQFPVAKVSMESYKERKAVSGQTITGLGKWWGRKPLILARATLLGILIPASSDPIKDNEIFLRILTMDNEGLLKRKEKSVPSERLINELKTMSPRIRERFVEEDELLNGEIILKTTLSRGQRTELQEIVFNRMPHSEKLFYCCRPEQVPSLDIIDWDEINNHLGTRANNISELICQLGENKFSKKIKVGDAFCGGGSIPFEAARLGCDVYGSDLNPIAALLSWASININGGGDKITEKTLKAQKDAFQNVDNTVSEWGIEHNSLGWRADAYLYCVEVIDPETGWEVPLAPSWVIAPKPRVIAQLEPEEETKRFEIKILENVSQVDYQNAKNFGTVDGSRLISPNMEVSIPVEVVRRNLRLWEKQDISPRPDDIFQERLYCVRWVETFLDNDGKFIKRRHYRAPTHEDLEREKRIIEYLSMRFHDWQDNSIIPAKKIEKGMKTDEPIRTRGWTYWHHLYNPRQLLINGLISEQIFESIYPVAVLLFLGRIINNNSKLSRWKPNQSGGIGGVVDVFSNQALNTFYNYGCRGLLTLQSLIYSPRNNDHIDSKTLIEAKDARNVNTLCDVWITDPPYADAIVYDEISEFFISWYEGQIKNIFPDWYTDSKRALAVRGSDNRFKKSMIECYKNLAIHMPSDGMQVVMFTHQDAAVWADLTTILWAAGLRVTAAWTIATETDSALKKGNYVQGTVLLILRKRLNSDPVFLDEINYRVELEVKKQLNTMLAIEDDSDPNFGDADYQLAAYAAALRVLTERPIHEINPEKEVLRDRPKGEIGPVEQLIRNAVKIACDHLVPNGFDGNLWKGLSPMERFYLKGIEVESHGEYRNGVYQELARGFGAVDYTDLLSSTKANETRLKRPNELGRKNLSGEGFSGSLVRHCLFGIYQTVQEDEVNVGLNWFRTELSDYWASREKIIKVLEYLATIGNVRGMEHWHKEAHAASLLAGAVRNDHV